MSNKGFNITVSLKEAKTFIKKILNAGRIPFLHGSPGCGKSTIIREIAKEGNLYLIDIRLSVHDATDFSGIPFPTEDGKKAKFLPMNLIPLESDPIPEGYDGFLIFWDEMNHADRSTAAAVYKVLLERELGEHKIHPDIVMVAAGNKDSDRAMVLKQSTATNSRMIHLELNDRPNTREWLDEYAIPAGLDAKVISYLAENQRELYDFDPSNDARSFCCPRSWEFVSDLLKNNDSITSNDLPIIAGTIGDGAANKFITHLRIFEKIPKMDDIIKTPSTVRFDENNVSIKWAVACTAAQHADKKNIDPICIFIERLGPDFSALFVRMIVKQDRSILSNPSVVKLASKMTKDFFGA